MVERQLPKLDTRVRFPSPAPAFARSIARANAGAVRRSLMRRRTGQFGSYGRQARQILDVLRLLIFSTARCRIHARAPAANQRSQSRTVKKHLAITMA